jgi:hypothetical protein
MAINLKCDEQIMCTDISGLFDYRLQTCHSAIKDIQLFVKSKTDVSFVGTLSLRVYLSPYPASGEGDAFVLYALRCLSGVGHHKSRRLGTDPIERRAEYTIHKK